MRQLQREVSRLRRSNAQLRQRIAALEEESERLKGLLEESERARHRQTSRFPRRNGTANPKRPGRKRGHRPSHRPRPEPNRIVAVPLRACPNCGGTVGHETTHQQFQIDLPPIVPIVTRFDIAAGHCVCCGKYVQGRHPDQISDAVGAAGVQLGPTILTMAAELKHRLGVPYRKISDFFATYLDIAIAPATFCRAEQRLSKKAEPTYRLLKDALKRCGIVHADETGWRVGRANAWLWVFTNSHLTVYAIRTGPGARGKAVPGEMLGEDFDGILIVDGLASYDALACRKGRCVGHLIRRTKDLIERSVPNDARYLRKLIAIVQDAIVLAPRRYELAPSTYRRKVGAINERLDSWLMFFGYQPSEDLKRLARHLRKHRPEWLRFLDDPAVPPTNNHAEGMLRGAVINRKIGGCNKTLKGALVHEVLASLMATCKQQGQRFLELALKFWRHPTPKAERLI